MYSKISQLGQKRLENEDKDIIEDFLKKGKYRKLKQNIISVTPNFINGSKNLHQWEILIKGRENSLFDKGFYPITVIFPENFPLKAPKIIFPKEFQHIHVYEDGEICLPLLTEKNWSSQYNFIYIINSIEDLIHNEPKITSPANSKLLDIYLNNRAEYENIIRRQAEKYSTNEEKKKEIIKNNQKYENHEKIIICENLLITDDNLKEVFIKDNKNKEETKEHETNKLEQNNNKNEEFKKLTLIDSNISKNQKYDDDNDSEIYLINKNIEETVLNDDYKVKINEINKKYDNNYNDFIVKNKNYAKTVNNNPYDLTIN